MRVVIVVAYTPTTEYPTVLRMSDPLLIRFDELSLLVGNTTFWAKIKFGVKFKGFMIFVSGNSMPVYIDDRTSEFPEKVSAGSVQINKKDKLSKLNKYAKEWIDKLEKAIAEQQTDNPVVRAIDRMTYQLHYDLTGSQVNFSEKFADEDFSDITIDRTPEIVSEEHPMTIPKTASELAKTLVIGSDDFVGLGQQMNVGYSAMQQVLSSTNEKINKVATNIKADTDLYTISKSLRDENDSDAYGGTVRSVSCSVKQQTDIEAANFENISVNQLGAFGTDGHPTLYSTIGTSDDSSSSTSVFGKVNSVKSTLGSDSDTGTSTIFGSVNNVSDKIGNSGDTSSSSVFGSISGVGTNVNAVSTKLGTDSTSGTMWYDILHRAASKAAPAGQTDQYSVLGRLEAIQPKINDLYTAQEGDGVSPGYVVYNGGVAGWTVRTS